MTESSAAALALSHLALRGRLMAFSRSQRAAWMAEQLRQHPETAAEVALCLSELSADLKADRPQPAERARKPPPLLTPGEYEEEERILHGGTITQMLAQMEAEGIPLIAHISPGRDYCDEVIKASWIRPLPSP